MSIDMTKLNSIQRAVIERLKGECKECKTAGARGNVFNGPVLNVLKGFCASDAEFAQLLHDSDKTLKGCFEAVSKSGYSGTSDFEVYSNAIRYYLPGVTVHMTLWVDMQGVDEGVAFGRDGEATLERVRTESEAQALREIAALKKQNDTHVQKVNFALNAIGRYLSDVQSEIDAMEAEEAGSGGKLRARCEAALANLLGKMGWSV